MKKLLHSLFLLIFQIVAVEGADWFFDEDIGWTFGRVEAGQWGFVADYGWCFFRSTEGQELWVWTTPNKWLYIDRKEFPHYWILENQEWNQRNNDEFILNPDLYSPLKSVDLIIGKEFRTLGLYEAGINPSGQIFLNNWRLKFPDSTTVFWSYSDVVDRGSLVIKNGIIKMNAYSVSGILLYNEFSKILYWEGKKYR
jgi:hypothetical protein